MKQLIRKMPFVKQFLRMRDDLEAIRAASEAHVKLQERQLHVQEAQLKTQEAFLRAHEAYLKNQTTQIEIQRMQARLLQENVINCLLADRKHEDTKRLNRHEGQVFSQNGEDGILAEIFARIGCTNRVFVEIGAGTGLENNTAYLLFCGWSGFWFEGDEQNVATIETLFYKPIKDGRLITAREFFTLETAASLFIEHHVPQEFDLLSIDIDRNTSWVWRALHDFRPRVIAIEYNASIPPQDVWEVEYDPEAAWNGSLYFGAGLHTLERIGADS